MPKKTNKKKGKLSELGKIITIPKKKEKKVEVVRKETKEKAQPKFDQQIFDEPTQFNRINLEDLMSPDSTTGSLDQGGRWIRIAQEEEKDDDEPSIYDLDKATKASYSAVGDYSTIGGEEYKNIGASGDYGPGSETPMMQDQNERDQKFNQVTEVKSYDTSKEKDFKRERERRGGVW